MHTELRHSEFAGPNDMRMLQETTFAYYPMKYMDDHKVGHVRCVRRTDFTFYFGEKDAQAINFVVIEAKRSGYSGSGEGQILVYMAMVWSERRKRKQSDCTVYGCLTDSG